MTEIMSVCILNLFKETSFPLHFYIHVYSKGHSRSGLGCSGIEFSKDKSSLHPLFSYRD